MEEIVVVAKIFQKQRTVEEIDIPLPQFLEEITEVIESLSQERISERMTMEGKSVATDVEERISERTVEQIVNVPVPEILEEPCDQEIPQERIVEHVTDVPATGEQIVSVLVLVIFEEIVDVVKLFSLDVPQKWIFERTCEQIVDVIREVVELISQERIQQLHSKQQQPARQAVQEAQSRKNRGEKKETERQAKEWKKGCSEQGE